MNNKHNSNTQVIMGIAIVILLLVVGYLFGKVQEIDKKQIIRPTPIPTITPTTKPAVKQIKVISTTAPVEKKKVSVVVTEVGSAGNYYCYEDKANTITMKQNELNTLHKLFEFCASDYRQKINNCNFNDPSANCPTGKECDEKSNNVQKAQSELWNMIKSSCP